MRDFSARCVGIFQEAVKWAPSVTRSHIQQYLINFENINDGLSQRVKLEAATESALQCTGFSQGPIGGGVSVCSCNETEDSSEVFLHLASLEH